MRAPVAMLLKLHCTLSPLSIQQSTFTPFATATDIFTVSTPESTRTFCCAVCATETFPSAVRHFGEPPARDIARLRASPGQ